jgi:hypothetical protein
MIETALLESPPKFATKILPCFGSQAKNEEVVPTGIVETTLLVICVESNLFHKE